MAKIGIVEPKDFQLSIGKRGDIEMRTEFLRFSESHGHKRDELYRTWRDVPYPEECVYSDFGELLESRTFRAGSGWNGISWPTSTTGSYDKTTWMFQPENG